MSDPKLSDAELERYSRHIMLDELGFESQAKLKQAKVLLIGVGGLGCPAAQYLAAAGIGSLIVCDDDKVELANLQRQLLYDDSQLGQPKATAAADRLRQTNPLCEVTAIEARAETGNLAELASGVNLVIDASDNFSTRHLLNRYCQEQRLNLVAGAAERFDGQVYAFAFAEHKAPCYNCLYPQEEFTPPATPCALLGVYAPLTGLIGTLMASAAIKMLTGMDQGSQHARLLNYDIRSMRMRQLEIKPAAGCAVCGG